MISFETTDLVLDGPGTELLGLSDAQLVEVNGTWRLVVTSEAEGAITLFDFNNGQIGAVLDSWSYNSNSGTRTLWNFTAFEAYGQWVIAPATRYEDMTRLYTIGGNGTLNRQAEAGAGDLGLTEAVTIGSSTFLFAQSRGQPTLTVYSVTASFTLGAVQTLTDTASTFLGDITAFASATVGGNTYLFTGSAFDAGLSSYRIAADGTLSLRDTVEPGDGSGFSRIAALETVEVGGTDFVVMASAGTSSLTVYSVSTNGTLTEVDYALDTLGQRFQGASELAAFTYDGRSYVAAAGSDDGVTLFQVSSSGTLIFEGVIEDTYGITLDNVASLDVKIVGGVPYLVVGSSTDQGATVLRLTIDTTTAPDPDDPPDGGPEMPTDANEVTGSAAGEYLRGSGGIDVIDGKGGDDRIEGRGGSDWLIDGAGRDVLTGMGGQDVFRFVEDDTWDVITDYGVGYDMIDLRDYAGVSSMADITLTEDCTGVKISVNNDNILIMNSGLTEYRVSDFTAADFIF